MAALMARCPACEVGVEVEVTIREDVTRSVQRWRGTCPACSTPLVLTLTIREDPNP